MKRSHQNTSISFFDNEIELTFKFIKARLISVNIDIYDWRLWIHKDATHKNSHRRDKYLHILLVLRVSQTSAMQIPLLISSHFCPKWPQKSFRNFLPAKIEKFTSKLLKTLWNGTTPSAIVLKETSYRNVLLRLTRWWSISDFSRTIAVSSA